MASLSRHWPTALILILGLGTTLAATLWVGRWERLSRQGEFQKQINNLTTALQRTTNRYNELLLAIGDLYAVNTNQVTRLNFSRFVQRGVQSYPGIQALEWAPLVPDNERAAYEQRLQGLFPQSTPVITERSRSGALMPANRRDSYIPVTFVEPWETNEAALGYDLASDETRRVALEQARDTGQLAATGRIQLVQETAENQYSFLVFLPVYQQPAQTPQARRQNLQGFILGVFRVADVVEESLTDLNYDIDFFILDKTAEPENQLLGFYEADNQQVVSGLGHWPAPVAPGQSAAESTVPNVEDLCPNSLNCTQTLGLGQRQWQLLFLPPRQPSPPWATLATLLIGLLMTAILLVYLSRWSSELQRTRELSELKLRLFSMASHELRTPLSVISVSAQSLGSNRNGLTPQQQASMVERIQIAAARMGQLVGDILTLARAEAGKLEVNPEIVELDGFCQQLFEQIQLKPGQTLHLEGNGCRTKAYLDKKLLHSLLMNLLSNAVKYSPADSPIYLTITATAHHLTFQVTDQGMGIPPAAQAQIFEAFYRGGNVSQIEGTGLGLAVAKTCVELQGGQLTLVSKRGAGTCMTAVLPRIE